MISSHGTFTFDKLLLAMDVKEEEMNNSERILLELSLKDDFDEIILRYFF